MEIFSLTLAISVYYFCGLFSLYFFSRLKIAGNGQYAYLHKNGIGSSSSHLFKKWICSKWNANSQRNWNLVDLKHSLLNVALILSEKDSIIMSMHEIYA